MSDVLRSVADVISIVCIVCGAVLALSGAIGVLRLREPIKAMHAATKPATLGVVLTGLGVMLQSSSLSTITKIAVVLAVQIATVSVGAHMLGRAMESSSKED